jgi:hypothetical protein
MFFLIYLLFLKTASVERIFDSPKHFRFFQKLCSPDLVTQTNVISN